jgi:hypothetical protein
VKTRNRRAKEQKVGRKNLSWMWRICRLRKKERCNDENGHPSWQGPVWWISLFYLELPDSQSLLRKAWDQC